MAGVKVEPGSCTVRGVSQSGERETRHARDFQNWSGTRHCTPVARAEPQGEAGIEQLVRHSARTGLRLKPVGAGHSWSDIACTDGVMLSLDRYADVLDVDRERHRVTVQAGIRLSDLGARLRDSGMAMSVLGSISEQSVAGAISTGTHGSGLGFGNLATSVVDMRLVTGRGETLEIDGSDPELLSAARVGLGALGVVSTVTLQCEPEFNLEEIAEPVRFERALDRLPQLLESHEHVKLWWLPHTDSIQIYLADRTGRKATRRGLSRRFDESSASLALFAALLRAGRARPAMIPALNRMVGGSIFKKERRVARADRVFNVAQIPVHRESEFAVSLDYGVGAMYALRDLIQREKLHVNFIVEMRFVAADDIMMSPAYGRDSCHIGAYMFESEGIDRYFAEFQRIMHAMGGRPHWGKEYSLPGPEIRELYPMAARFNEIRRKLDPRGVFENDFIRRLFEDGV